MAMDNLTANHFTAHSLGNANDITASIGAVECLICAVSVWFLYWQANKMRNLARRMTHLETTAANYTVQVGKMPTDCKEAECANFFSAFGPVVHVGISYTYRELIIASRARAARREELLRCQVAWYLAKSKDQPGRVKKRAAIGVAHAKHRLYKADVALKAIRSCRTRARAPSSSRSTRWRRRSTASPSANRRNGCEGRGRSRWRWRPSLPT